LTIATFVLFGGVFTVAIALLLKKSYRLQMSELFAAESTSVLEVPRGASVLPFSVTVERPRKVKGTLASTTMSRVRSLVRWLIYISSGLGVLYVLDVLFLPSSGQFTRLKEYSTLIGLILLLIIVGSWVRPRVASSGLWFFSFMAGVALGTSTFGVVFITIPHFFEQVRQGLFAALIAILGLFFLWFMIMLGLVVVGLMIFGLLWVHRSLMQSVPASPAYAGMVFFWAGVCFVFLSYQFNLSYQIPVGGAPSEKLAKFFLLPLILYAAATMSLLRVLNVLFPTGRPISLLFLRSFRRSAKSERFFYNLVHEWTEFGSIFALSGPDIVNTTLDSRMLAAHLTSKLEAEFISSIDNLKDRLAAVRTVRNWDLLYRVEEFKCLGSVWTKVFHELLGRCDVVLLDLRGFERTHTGTALELFTIIQSGQTRKTLVLCDETTSITAVEEIGRAALPQTGNAMARGAQGITLVGACAGAYRTTRLAVPMLTSMVMANSDCR
jgi:hypothetical protein